RYCPRRSGSGLHQLGRRGALETIGKIAQPVEGCQRGGNRARPEGIEYRAILPFPRTIGNGRRGLALGMDALRYQTFAHVNESAGTVRQLEPRHPIQVFLKTSAKTE